MNKAEKKALDKINKLFKPKRYRTRSVYKCPECGGNYAQRAGFLFHSPCQLDSKQIDPDDYYETWQEEI